MHRQTWNITPLSSCLMPLINPEPCKPTSVYLISTLQSHAGSFTQVFHEHVCSFLMKVWSASEEATHWLVFSLCLLASRTLPDSLFYVVIVQCYLLIYILKTNSRQPSRPPAASSHTLLLWLLSQNSSDWLQARWMYEIQEVKSNPAATWR